LQPTTTRPSSTSAAAPTGKFEYGAYALPITSTAAARSATQSISVTHRLCPITRACPDVPARVATGRGTF